MTPAAGPDSTMKTGFRLASAKDLDAQLKAATSYERGLWGANQKGEALRWYERAAHNGSVKTTLLLGTYYRAGKGSQRKNKRKN